jgi:hypothetical protein
VADNIVAPVIASAQNSLVSIFIVMASLSQIGFAGRYPSAPVVSGNAMRSRPGKNNVIAAGLPAEIRSPAVQPGGATVGASSTEVLP